jgi:hypothetical protein
MLIKIHFRRSVIHPFQAAARAAAGLLLCALTLAGASAGEVSVPDSGHAPQRRAPLAYSAGGVYQNQAGLPRVTCPGPEQTRVGREWFAASGEEGRVAPRAVESPATWSGAERVRPVVIQIPSVEFPRPATVPDITPAWEPKNVEDGSFRWGAAIQQSLRFLAIQHAFRMATEEGSRAEIKGKFFKDYFATLRRVRTWHDGDPFIVNYIGHPMMGAVSGYIQVQNDPRGVKQEVGFNKEYFKSRLKAFGWSALYSTQFELGPLGEAAFGNVGIRPTKTWKYPMGYVDLVVTPVVGTMWLVGEDTLDRWVVLPLESRVRNKTARLLIRSFLNPSRSMANVLRSKWPWYRDDRRL